MKEALETMCRRCTNHEMCQGTGCEPKKVLAALVKKQTPKKVKSKTHRWYGKEPFCPVCHGLLTKRAFIYANGEEGNEEKIAYCDWCGQAIDWSDWSDEE